MLNHPYGLLLNLDAAQAPAGTVPGDELVDPAFHAVTLPGYLGSLRRTLFGADPDRFMLCYRARQLLAVTSATFLNAHLLALDPRVTYDFLDAPYADPAVFAPAAVMVAGPADAALTFLGVPAAPDVTGRCRHSLRVEVLTPTTGAVTRLTPPVTRTAFEFALTEGLSGPVTLPGTGYACALSSDDVTQAWQVDVVNRPQLDPATLVEAAAAIGEPALDALLGVTAAEPYLTFRNLWRHAGETPLRLAALTCALVYRTEERRLAVV